jgi:hypothetical protein
MTGVPLMPATIHTRADATARLAALGARRNGALLAGASMVPLGLAGVLAPAAACVGVAASVVLWCSGWVAKQVLVEDWVMRDDLAEIPDVARARAQLVAPERRREIADALRRIASPSRVSRHDVVPLLVDRVGPVREQLLEVADQLDRGVVLDPRTMAELAGLVHDGARSPLLNGNVPESEVAVVLRRVRYRLAIAAGDDPHPAS